jgi:hypothetical protein
MSSARARAMTLLDRDFVCAGCGQTFPISTPSKYVKREGTPNGLERERMFHSVDCLIEWERREVP